MKKFKYTKIIKNKGINFKKVNYGTWAIQSLEYGILSVKHVNLLKQYLKKNFKRIKKFKFSLTCNKIITKKPSDSRMGGGKGVIHDEQYFLKPGAIFLEFYNTSANAIFSIFKLISNKIFIKVRLININ